MVKAEDIFKKYMQSVGFEPTREVPNGFLVHRLNHSATTAYFEPKAQHLDTSLVDPLIKMFAHLFRGGIFWSTNTISYLYF